MNHIQKQKVKFTKDNYFKKMKQENERMLAMERKIQEMEKMESQLLGRLRNS